MNKKLIALAMIIYLTGCGKTSQEQIAICKMLAYDNHLKTEREKSQYIATCMIANGYEFIGKHDFGDELLLSLCNKNYLDGKPPLDPYYSKKFKECYAEVYDKIYVNPKRWKKNLLPF